MVLVPPLFDFPPLAARTRFCPNSSTLCDPIYHQLIIIVQWIKPIAVLNSKLITQLE